MSGALIGLLPTAHSVVTGLGLLPERWVRVERPLLTLPGALAVAFVAHRLLALSERQSPGRRRLTEGFLLGAALAAALGAAGVELGRPIDRLAVILVIDRSRSVDLVPDAEARLRAELQIAELGMRDEDRLATVAFAAEAAVEEPLRPRTQLPAPQRAELGRDGTDLGNAIRRALAELPSDSASRVVVISDGVNTRGNPLDGAAAAVAAGVPIDVVALDQARVPDVRLVDLGIPARAHEGEAMHLRVVTEATAEAEIEVRLSRDGEVIRKGTATIARGEDVITLREIAPGPGLHRYDVAITARDQERDQAPEDNAGSAFLRVLGPGTALVMEHDPALAAPLARALEEAAFRVRTVGPGGVPADVAELSAYDVVVLGEIRASDLTPSQLDALATYTRDLGGGLLLMGGDRALGPGGYAKTPVEEVSPVSFDLKQDRRRASLAEVIIIDYSGSMAMRATSSHTKLDLANEAAARSAELLGAGDRVGVMHVDEAVTWTVPLAAVTDPKEIAKRIRAVGPGGGGIYVDLSLKTAYAALAREHVNLKHVLLFADGSDAEERTLSPTLVSRAKAQGISTSVVALGSGPDVPDLERLSRLGDGRFYLIEDASRLPAVFAQETVLAARSAINEVAFRPVLGTPAAPTRGIDFASGPPLTGYVVTIPKPRAQVLLRGPENDPTLATWSIGIGRAGTFTSDFRDRWGEAWTSWTGASKLFGQLGRDLSRQADDPRVRLEADAAAGELHVRATVVDDDGRAESFRRLVARVGGPDGFRTDTPLEPVGAGVYAARVPLSRPGAFVVAAVDEATQAAVGTTGAVLTIGEELRPTGTDRALLRRLAELTGGKVRDTLAGVFRDRDVLRFAYRSITETLIIWAALLLLLAVAARRLAMPEALTALPARWRATRAARAERHARRRAAAPMADTDATTQVLLTSRREARAERAGAATGDARPHTAAPLMRPPPVAAPVERPAAAPPPLPVAARQPPAHPAASADGGAPPPSARAMSAAEILLARRRGKR
ncbi:MAG: VWA domain-containing protein [Polyangiaceae bacterium]|nr:VWA domain-containing protein [Polyangiaceae bacterium]